MVTAHFSELVTAPPSETVLNGNEKRGAVVSLWKLILFVVLDGIRNGLVRRLASSSQRIATDRSSFGVGSGQTRKRT